MFDDGETARHDGAVCASKRMEVWLRGRLSKKKVVNGRPPMVMSTERSCAATSTASDGERPAETPATAATPTNTSERRAVGRIMAIQWIVGAFLVRRFPMNSWVTAFAARLARPMARFDDHQAPSAFGMRIVEVGQGRGADAAEDLGIVRHRRSPVASSDERLLSAWISRDFVEPVPW